MTVGKRPVVLPARWRAGAGRFARRLLQRAERTMRALRTVRESEIVRSIPGFAARTQYRLVAPDRLAFRTNTGNDTVVIGGRQWYRTNRGPWVSISYGSGLPFSTRSWFRWTPYARSVRLLERRRRHGRRVALLALADTATPVWFRLLVDERTGRVLRERMTARAHFATTRYHAFNHPMEIEPPHVRSR